MQRDTNELSVRKIPGKLSVELSPERLRPFYVIKATIPYHLFTKAVEYFDMSLFISASFGFGNTYVTKVCREAVGGATQI